MKPDAHLPVREQRRYRSDKGVPPVITETNVVVDRTDTIICTCEDDRTARYIANTMNRAYVASRRIQPPGELWNDVCASIIVNGECPEKETARYPYQDADGIVRFRQSAAYREYIGKWCAGNATYWKSDLKGVDRVLMVAKFHLPNANRLWNMGDLVATVVDGLTKAGILNNKRRMVGILDTRVETSNDGAYTEVYLLRVDKERNG